MSFLKPCSVKDPIGPFTISLEMTAYAAIFCREETASYTMIRRGEFRGYGHVFEKAYTVSEIENSTGHHRIISYRLGGLHFLVRHETDGFVHDMTITGGNLVNSMDVLTISPKQGPLEKGSFLSKLTIKRDGQAVPRKNPWRSKLGPYTTSSLCMMLLCSPESLKHETLNGKFRNTELVGFTSQLEVWEQDYRKEITQLVALINRIISTTTGFGGSAVIRYNCVTDKLVIENAERKNVLPDDLYAL